MKSIAILARSNADVALMAEYLISKGIPVNIPGGVISMVNTLGRALKYLGHSEKSLTKQKAAISIERYGQYIKNSFSRNPERSEFYKSEITNVFIMSRLKDIPAFLKDCSECSSDSVTVSTVHYAKGLEWDHVYIVGIDSFEDSVQDRNMVYVAMTRAKKSLGIVATSIMGEKLPNHMAFSEKVKTSAMDLGSLPSMPKPEELVSGGNHIVIARAGSGKTTLIRSASNLVSEDMLYVCFSKNTAESSGIDGSTTMHSLCFQSLRAHFFSTKGSNVVYDRSKDYSLLNMGVAELGLNRRSMRYAKKLVDAFKNAGKDPFVIDNDGKSPRIFETEFSYVQEAYKKEISENNGLEKGEEWLFKNRTILQRDIYEGERLAGWVLRRSGPSGPLGLSVSYDDMIWWCLAVPGLKLPSVKYVFVDEAQDLTMSSIQVLGKMHRENGSNIIAVGDPDQTIYQFRGIGQNPMVDLEGMLDFKTWSLTKSWRVPSAISDQVRMRTYVSDFESHDVGGDFEVYDNLVGFLSSLNSKISGQKD